VHGRDVSVEFDGFTNVVDVGKGKDGALYVVQITSTGLAGPPSPGKLIRIDRDGKQTELLAGQLQEPTGVTVSAQGDVYVTNNGGSPTDGQILRVAAADTGGD
jgi:glucose/arabinose dehydrogenase